MGAICTICRARPVETGLGAQFGRKPAKNQVSIMILKAKVSLRPGVPPAGPGRHSGASPGPRKGLSQRLGRPPVPYGKEDTETPQVGLVRPRVAGYPPCNGPYLGSSGPLPEPTRNQPGTNPEPTRNHPGSGRSRKSTICGVSEVVLGPSVFWEAWGTKAKKPHMFKKRVVS